MLEENISSLEERRASMAQRVFDLANPSGGIGGPHSNKAAARDTLGRPDTQEEFRRLEAALEAANDQLVANEQALMAGRSVPGSPLGLHALREQHSQEYRGMADLSGESGIALSQPTRAFMVCEGGWSGRSPHVWPHSESRSAIPTGTGSNNALDATGLRLHHQIMSAPAHTPSSHEARTARAFAFLHSRAGDAVPQVQLDQERAGFHVSNLMSASRHESEEGTQHVSQDQVGSCLSGHIVCVCVCVCVSVCVCHGV